MTPAPRRVLVGVSGGIAAYKSVELVRALVGRGMEVRVVMTAAAEAFVSPLALATVSGRPVRRTLLDVSEEGEISHIELATWPDAIVVAPATAHTLARAALGLADDLLTTVLLASDCPKIWAPAMNSKMWTHPATTSHVACLRARGDAFIDPTAGELACGVVGVGRMADAADIASAVAALGTSTSQSWAGRHVLISAGPTRTYLDPVRFISNESTGLMGFQLADQARRRGARVTIVAGPTALPTPADCVRVDVRTAVEMHAAMDRVLADQHVDLVAMVAAVSDVAASREGGEKLVKRELLRAFRAGLLVEGIDVLRTLAHDHHGRAFFLGFGAQTSDAASPELVEQELIAAGRSKLGAKRCDAIFVNRVGVDGVGFGSPTNAGVLITADDVESTGLEPRSKADVAAWILDRLASRVVQEDVSS